MFLYTNIKIKIIYYTNTTYTYFKLRNNSKHLGTNNRTVLLTDDDKIVKKLLNLVINNIIISIFNKYSKIYTQKDPEKKATLFHMIILYYHRCD